MRLSVKSPVVQIGAAVLAFAGGIFVGRQVAKKQYESRLDLEILEAKRFYKEMYEQKEAKIDEGIDELEGAIQELVVDLGYVEDRPQVQKTNYNKPPKPQPVVVQAETVVVVSEDPDAENLEWDYETETGRRVPEIPYIIHRDEYENREQHLLGFSQVSMTYYEDDDVLVDEGDSVISDMYKLLGMDTLQFGHGSGDPNVVFIRNEYLEMDFEVNLHRGSYEREVMGLEPEPELQHSHRSRRSREWG